MLSTLGYVEHYQLLPAVDVQHELLPVVCVYEGSVSFLQINVCKNIKLNVSCSLALLQAEQLCVIPQHLLQHVHPLAIVNGRRKVRFKYKSSLPNYF